MNERIYPFKVAVVERTRGNFTVGKYGHYSSKNYLLIEGDNAGIFSGQDSFEQLLTGRVNELVSKSTKDNPATIDSIHVGLHMHYGNIQKVINREYSKEDFKESHWYSPVLDFFKT